MNWAKIGLFAGGALFGSAGIELLTSKDAKKVYGTHSMLANWLPTSFLMCFSSSSSSLHAMTLKCARTAVSYTHLFPTHTVVQAAAVTGCDGVRDAPFL